MHKRQHALELIIKALRKRLKKANKYAGSLLEQMDMYGIKLTELSPNPITLRPEKDFPPPTAVEQSEKPRKKKKAKQ